MRKAHFGAIDGTAAGGLDDGQPVMVFRVEDDALGGNLLSRTRSEMPPAWLEGLLPATVDSNRTFRVSSAADMVPRQFGVMSGDGGRVGRCSDATGARRFGSVHGALGGQNGGFYLIGGRVRVSEHV